MAAKIITRPDERSVVALRALQGDQGVGLRLAKDEDRMANDVAKGGVVEVLATEQELADVLSHRNERGHLWELARGKAPDVSSQGDVPAAPPTIKPENAGKAAKAK
jgi:hypothetical protein